MASVHTRRKIAHTQHTTHISHTHSVTAVVATQRMGRQRPLNNAFGQASVLLIEWCFSESAIIRLGRVRRFARIQHSRINLNASLCCPYIWANTLHTSNRAHERTIHMLISRRNFWLFLVWHVYVYIVPWYLLSAGVLDALAPMHACLCARASLRACVHGVLCVPMCFHRRAVRFILKYKRLLRVDWYN